MLPVDSLLARLLDSPASPAESFATAAQLDAQAHLLRSVSTYLRACQNVLDDYEQLNRVAERAMPSLPAPILAYLKALQ